MADILYIEDYKKRMRNYDDILQRMMKDEAWMHFEAKKTEAIRNVFLSPKEADKLLTDFIDKLEE